MIPPDDVFEGSYLVRLRRSAPGIDVWSVEITVHPDDERDAGHSCAQQWRPFVRGNLVVEADPWAAFLVAVALAWSTAQRKRQARRECRILMGRPFYLTDAHVARRATRGRIDP